MKAEKKRIVMAFADVTDFGPWARRAEPEEFADLMAKIYDRFARFHGASECSMKLLADGFLAIKELTDSTVLRKFVRDIFVHGQKVNAVIRHTAAPRPGLCRFRLVVGWAWKVYLADGTVDYLGYQVNYCQRLLEVCRKTEIFLMSESTRDGLSRGRDSRLKLRKLTLKDVTLSGVDPEDLRTVYAFKFTR